MQCKKCKSFKVLQTKEGKLYCMSCGYVGLINKKKGNFITRMFKK